MVKEDTYLMVAMKTETGREWGPISSREHLNDLTAFDSSYTSTPKVPPWVGDQVFNPWAFAVTHPNSGT